MKKFEYKELGRAEIVDLAYKKRKELDQKGIKYPEIGSFRLGLDVLGKDGWELIQVNLWNPSEPPSKSFPYGRTDEVFYFKREMK